MFWASHFWFCFFVGNSPAAYGWGYQGHEIVGSIADALLSDNAKNKVAQILGFSLKTTGPWADCVKSVIKQADGTFQYTPDPQHPEYQIPCVAFAKSADEVSRMEDYVGRNWATCDAKQHCADTYHFADVPIERDGYSRSYVGTSDHDVVSAINAAITVLEGQPVPAPFNIKDQKEALLLLAHLVGDLHQPLHVGAIYLDETGQIVDPPAGDAEQMSTQGGNLILEGHGNLHHDWDEIPASLGVDASEALLALARSQPPAPGPVGSWASSWARDTALVSRAAFSGSTFTPAPQKGHWKACFADYAEYHDLHNAIQIAQLAKAGAHLAEVLNALWP